jgi:asparagine synthase (glutamine-hydrolysing)
VIVGGWGSPALRLLDRATPPGDLERVGRLAVAGGAAAGEGRWRCWLSGRLTNAEELARRFGGDREQPAALAASAFAAAGAGACDCLRGTFVLVALDREREEALLLRDSLGGRPLVYAEQGDGILFAEHERELLALLPTAPAPDPLALGSWVDRGTVPSGQTLFAGVRRLQPGERLVLSNAGHRIEAYWRPRFAETLSGSREQLAAQLRDAAFAAVDRAAAGPGRVGLRLSGGLDSACVAAGLAAREGDAPAPLALAAVFPTEAATDERELIEATAAQAGLDLKCVAIADGSAMLDLALAHIGRWRLPPSSPNLFVWEPVAARGREHDVGALLDGEGGDELFGLAPQLIADRLRQGRLAGAWALTGAIPGIGRQPDRRLRRRALRRFGVAPLLPGRLRRPRHRRAALAAQGSLLRAEVRLALWELEEQADAAAALDGPHWWRSLAASLTADGELFDVPAHRRRTALDAGIDGRHPFLFDRELLELVLRIPPQLQFDPVRDRALLRDGLHGHVPEQVRGRNAKSYFTPLLVSAIAGPAGAPLAASLSDGAAPIRAFVHPDALARLLAARAPAMGGVPALRLWRAGVADAWLRVLE